MLNWQDLHLRIPPTTFQKWPLTLCRPFQNPLLSPLKPLSRNQGFSTNPQAPLSLIQQHLHTHIPIYTYKSYNLIYQDLMAPVLSRSLTSASVVSLPSYSSSFSLKNTNRGLSLKRNAFLGQNGLRNSLFWSGLKWKIERRERGAVVRCEATVAEKEAPETSGERHEYQAEVSLSQF